MQDKYRDPIPPDFFDDEDPEPGRPYLLWLGWLVAGIVLLYVFSPWLGKALLTISRSANQPAYFDALSEIVGSEESFQLPTYTPRPTYTALPTHTPRPTYTPFPTATNTHTPTHTPTPTFTPSPTPVPPAFIIQQLETQAQLVVVKDELTNRGFHVGVNDGLCSHGGDFTAHGVIEAGLDFDEIDADSVTYDPRSQSYTLKLPAPELTSCRIEYIRLVKNSFSMCSPDWDRTRTLAEVQVMSGFVKHAREDGLLEEAAERSELILGEFVRTLTGQRVNVVFEQRRASPKLDASCRPRAIGGWRYNSAKNIWQR